MGSLALVNRRQKSSRGIRPYKHPLAHNENFIVQD
jgi:hypothetical protein